MSKDSWLTAVLVVGAFGAGVAFASMVFTHSRTTHARPEAEPRLDSLRYTAHLPDGGVFTYEAQP